MKISQYNETTDRHWNLSFFITTGLEPTNTTYVIAGTGNVSFVRNWTMMNNKKQFEVTV